MKISVASDVHLEFQQLELTNDDNSDVLVLAGDILVADDIKRYPFDKPVRDVDSDVQRRAVRYQQFLHMASAQWKNVIYVAGNHEHYDSTYEKVDDILRNAVKSVGSNIHYLQRSTVEIDGVVFVGGTMWTNLNKQDHLTAYHLSHAMSDYKKIKTKQQGIYRKLRPQDTLVAHNATVGYIKTIAEINRGKKVVAVTHHAPTLKSISPYYINDTLMNGGYVSDLSDLILDNDNIVVWFHGHVHDQFDYKVGDGARVVCNPRGYYGYETSAHNFTLKTIEI